MPEARAASQPVEPIPKGGFERLWRRLQDVDLTEPTIIVALVALTVGVRLLRLHYIEFYDDTVSAWHFVRQWFHENDFSHARWTHHMARLGLNAQVYLVQAVFGREPRNYYILPVASYALQVLLVYGMGRRVGGRASGVIGALLLCVFTGTDRASSQLLPDGFGAMALALVGYLLVRYHDATPRHARLWLIGAGLAFLWSYLIKESNLLLLPGTALSVWLCRGRLRDVLPFCAVLLVGIAIETLCFRLFTDYSHRLAIVEESHGIATVTFWELFERFTRLEPPWQMLFWTWVPSALWLTGSNDRRIAMVLLLPATFVFLLTFLVRDVNPIVLWTRFFSRYFEPAAPFFAVAVGLFTAQAVGRAWAAHSRPSWQFLPSLASEHAAALVVGLCGLVAVVQRQVNRTIAAPDAMTEIRRVSAVTNDAFRRNLPIVQKRAPRGELEERRVRSLKEIYGVYLDDEAIVGSPLAKAGVLPDITDAIKDGERYSYVVRDPKAYGGSEIERYVERGCAVVVDESLGNPRQGPGVPTVVMKPHAPLPERCRAPAR